MEHGNSFFHYDQPKKSSSESKALQKQKVVQRGEAAREENQNMSIACVQRLIRKALPNHAKVREESKERIIACVREFISFITVEANQHCKVEQRKTVTAEDLIYAMAKLGLDKYAEVLTLYLYRCRQHQGVTRVPHRAGSLPALPGIANGFPVIPPMVPFPYQNPINGWVL